MSSFPQSVLQEKRSDLGWTTATLENSPGKSRLKYQSAGNAEVVFFRVLCFSVLKVLY